MTVWLIVFVFLLVLAFRPKDAKLFSFVFILLYLLAALRNPEIGQTDTESVYLPGFRHMLGQPLNVVIEEHKEKDLFFYICTYFIRLITTEEQLYLAICALPFFITSYMLIRKYSNNYAMSIASFMAINFYSQSFTMIRHSIALGCVTLAYYFLKGKDTKKMLVSIAFAPLFHISAISSVVSFFADMIKFKVKYYFIALSVGLLSSIAFVKLLQSSLVANLFASFSRFEEYEQSRIQEENLGYTLAIIVNLLMFFCIRYYKEIKDNTVLQKSINIDYWMLTIGSLSSFLLVVMGEFMRITSFFIIPLMIILPQVFKENKKSIAFVLLAFAYFFFRQSVHSEIFDYRFYFE